MTTKEEIAMFRKALKKLCPTLSIRNAPGTAWGWVDIRGSDSYGNFTETERATLALLGLAAGGNLAVISPDNRNLYLKKVQALVEAMI